VQFTNASDDGDGLGGGGLFEVVVSSRPGGSVSVGGASDGGGASDAGRVELAVVVTSDPAASVVVGAFVLVAAVGLGEAACVGLPIWVPVVTSDPAASVVAGASVVACGPRQIGGDGHSIADANSPSEIAKPHSSAFST